METRTKYSDPVNLIKAFIACVGRKDTEAMRNLIHPNATACLIRESEPKYSSLHESIDVLERAHQEYTEACWDEIVHADDNYATVWESFSIHKEGQVSGTEPIMLIALLICNTASLDRVKLILLLE